MSYATTQHHLIDELDRLRTVLEHHGSADGHAPSEPPESDGGTPVRDPADLSLALPEETRERVAEQRERIDRRCRDTGPDTTLRLRLLADRFDLARPHLDALLLALAPEIDDGFGSLYRDINDDHLARRLTVGLVEDLFARTDEERLAASALVGPGSVLRRNGFVRVDDPPGKGTSSRDREVVVTDRIVTYLKGHDDVDPALASVASLVTPGTAVGDLRLEDDVRARVEALAAAGEGRVNYFHGPEGAGKRRAVDALAEGRILRADLDAVLEADAVERLRREALLQDCPVHLTGVTGATADPGVADPGEAGFRDDRPTVDAVVDALSEFERDLYLTGTDQWTPSSGRLDADYALVEFPGPGFELRRECWERHADALADDVDPELLASTFELTQGGIDDAVATARALAHRTGEQSPPLSREAVVEGCKAQSAEGLAALAEQIEPAAGWDDIVLPSDTFHQLEEVAAHVKHRGTLYEEWGFEERFSRGTGVVAMFAGPSGTGKTLAAEIIAADAGMDLYKIDLASVVSKYIGETEENLERIFEAARDSNAILLFDEAEAVFGTRAEVSEATDRYANVEVNYLLQRIETYDGVVLLTTNNESQVDDAFTRRINQTVSFERPDKSDREAIWRIMFPEDTPTADLDYSFLAELDLAGGNIRNAAQTAAVMAVDDGGVVRMRHVIEAVKRELDKVGRLLDPTDFDEYRQFLGASVADSETPSPDRPTASGETDAGSSTPDRPTGSGGTGSGSVGKNDESAGTTPAEATSGTAGDSPGARSAPDREEPDGTPADPPEGDEPGPGAGESTAEPTPETGTDAGSGVGDAPGADRSPAGADRPDREGADGEGDRSGTGPADDGQSRDLPDGSPEQVVRRFFDYLNEGDGESAMRLYHSGGSTEEFTPQELVILEQSTLVIEDVERVVEGDHRVVLQFTQRLNGEKKPLQYELRPEDGEWRIFELGQPRPDDNVVDL